MYKELSSYPEYINQLSNYELAKLRDYANSLFTEAMKLIHDLVHCNPPSNYQYPEEFENDTTEYWIQRSSSASNSRYVMSIIDRKLNTDNQSKPFTLGAYVNWRQRAIVERFKIDSGEMPDYDPSKTWIEKTGGKKNYEVAINSMKPARNSKSYKPASKSEIESSLPHLQDSPKALELAKSKLDELL